MPRSYFLTLAVFIKLVLSVVQVIAGLFSGSLSLVADALHNLIDAGSIFVAIIARNIGAKQPDDVMTFGYQRAEVIGVLVNSTSLIAIGCYLIYQSFGRLLFPVEVDGEVVTFVGLASLVIDILTAGLIYLAGAKDSLNIWVVFIHNLADSIASLGVIIGGVIIWLYDFDSVDLIITLMISLYIIFQGILLLKKSIRILMQAVPESLCLQDVREAIESVEQVEKVSNLYIWQLSDKEFYFEGRVQIKAPVIADVKSDIRDLLQERFNIGNAIIETLEGSR
jgi:cobalt-zinc-cadmium efflux system protein